MLGRYVGTGEHSNLRPQGVGLSLVEPYVGVSEGEGIEARVFIQAHVLRFAPLPAAFNDDSYPEMQPL